MNKYKNSDLDLHPPARARDIGATSDQHRHYGDSGAIRPSTETTRSGTRFARMKTAEVHGLIQQPPL